MCTECKKMFKGHKSFDDEKRIATVVTPWHMTYQELHTTPPYMHIKCLIMEHNRHFERYLS